MNRKVLLSSFHNGKVEYCAIFGSGDIEENASVIFFYSDFISSYYRFQGCMQGICKKRKRNVLLKWCLIQENWKIFLVTVGIHV